MKQQQFIQQNQSLWTAYNAQLDNFNRKKRSDSAANLSRIEQRNLLLLQYNQVCQHLTLSRTRGYSPLLIEQLQASVIRGHNLIYQVKNQGTLLKFLQFFSQTFPRAVRAQWPAVALSAFLFWGVGITMGLVCYFFPDMIYTVMSHEKVLNIEWMYNPSNPLIGRDSTHFDQSRFQMFGFYIFNNTSIGLRVFASGILLGIGCVVQLVLNGLFIGAIAGHLTEIGYNQTFWSFVAGHSAFELGAITLSGAAGLLLAKGIWRASVMQRLDYLKHQALLATPIIVGASLMFILAATIEGFWSPQPNIPNGIKYSVGLILLSLTVLYFVFVGREAKPIVAPQKEDLYAA